MRRASCRSMLGLCAGLVAVLVLASCGGDDGDARQAPASARTIDRVRATGRRPAAKASATVKRPQAIAVRISAAPKQRVGVVWALSCTSAKQQPKTSGGSYVTRSPDIRTLKLPDGPNDLCAVEATAKIPRGRVKATLLAKAP